MRCAVESVILEERRIILLDSDGSLKGNIETTTKELGRPNKEISGDVQFLSEENYDKARKDRKAYRESLGQTKKVYDYRHAHLPEAEVRELNAGRGNLSSEDDGYGLMVSCNLFDATEESNGGWVMIDGRLVFVGNVNQAVQVFGVSEESA